MIGLPLIRDGCGRSVCGHVVTRTGGGESGLQQQCRDGPPAIPFATHLLPGSFPRQLHGQLLLLHEVALPTSRNARKKYW